VFIGRLYAVLVSFLQYKRALFYCECLIVAVEYPSITMARLSQCLLILANFLAISVATTTAQGPQPTRIQIAFETTAVNNMLELSRKSTLPDRSPIPVSSPDDFGIDLAYLKDLRNKFENEWTASSLEGILNQFEHFTVPIGEGSDAFSLHYILAKSNRTDATPLMILHGWPGGSVLSYRDVIH
jgi:hypothetical protein